MPLRFLMMRLRWKRSRADVGVKAHDAGIKVWGLTLRSTLLTGSALTMSAQGVKKSVKWREGCPRQTLCIATPFVVPGGFFDLTAK